MNLSPLPVQKFFDNNGQPLVKGLLFTYAAGTTTKIATYQDSAGGASNTNPIVLDFRGECRLWLDPALAYKFVLSPAGDTDPPTRSIWTVDNITVAPVNFENSAVDTGTTNNISLSIPQITAVTVFTRVIFKAANTNTGATTLQINGGTAKAVTWQNTAAFAGGEIQIGGLYEAIYDGARWQLQGPTLQSTQMRTAGEISAEVTPADYEYLPGNVLRYPGASLSDKLNTAIQSLPSTGGIIDATGWTGALSFVGQVLLNKANVTINFGSATFTMSGVPVSHDPVTFGAYFYCTVANCWVIGNSGTVFKLGSGENADIAAWGNGATGGGMLYCELDGNKANNTSIADDSFQSGVQIINGSVGDSAVTIKYCKIHDFNHYGIVTYGDYSNGNFIEENEIYSNGKADALGTGDGIYINLGSGRNTVKSNKIFSNQRSGIRASSVGVNQSDNKIQDNWCGLNGINGIFLDEEATVGSTSGFGQLFPQISGNTCNGNAEFGIRAECFDNVGFIIGMKLTDNECYGNVSGGYLIGSNNHATNNTRESIISGNGGDDNGGDGLKIGANVLDSLLFGNVILRSGSGININDLGTRTIEFGNKVNITDTAFSAGIPIFLAYLSANATNQTGNNAVVTVLFDTEVFDAQANYDPTTGIFTATTAGDYRFSSRVHFNSLAATATTMLLQLVTTLRTYQCLDLATYVALTARTLQVDEVVNMAVGDTAKIQALVNGMGANTAGFAGGSTPVFTSFSCNFLGS